MTTRIKFIIANKKYQKSKQDHFNPTDEFEELGLVSDIVAFEGVAALWKQGFIDYLPNSVNLKAPTGYNFDNTSLRNKAEQGGKSLVTRHEGVAEFKVGIVTIKGVRYTGPERCLCDVVSGLTKLEGSAEKNVVKNLMEACSKKKFKSYAALLKIKTLPNEIQKWLEELDFKDVFKSYFNKNKMHSGNANKTLRVELVEALNKITNSFVVSGGCAIEMYILPESNSDVKRATQDIDGWTKISIGGVEQFVKQLNELAMFWKFDLNTDVKNGMTANGIFQCALKCKLKKRFQKYFASELPMSIDIEQNNLTDREEFVRTQKNEFGHQIKFVSANVILGYRLKNFINESRAQNYSRSKELIDLVILKNNEDVNFKEITDFILTKDNNDKKTVESLINEVMQAKTFDLPKMRDNFDSSLKFYEIKKTIPFDDALEIKNYFLDGIVKELQKRK